jgi:hypothetical protein
MEKDNSERDLIIQDFLKVQKQFVKDDLGLVPTRDYYEANGNYKGRQYCEVFGSFVKLKNEAVKVANINEDEFKQKKQIYILTEKNKTLEKENQKFLKHNINIEDFLNLYKQNIEETIKFKINNKKIIIKNDEGRKAILQLSDWHIGEIVRLEAFNNVNE